MNPPDKSSGSRPVTLSVPLAERWTLHHVLLDRIDQEVIADEPTEVQPPPVEVYQAFETLDAGETSFTIAQLEAIREILAQYHHSTSWWESDRSRLEGLLHRISNHIDHQQTTRSAD